MTPYADLIRQTAIKYGVDPGLAMRVVGAESGYNPKATSPKGAMGLAQIMPGTAKELGVTDPYDPAQNVDAGIRYLKQQLDTSGGDVPLALAAYNAGPGAVKKYGGVPPYPETQDYIAKITGKRPLAAEGFSPVDARQASLQMPPGTPTGDPMTGTSLPPDLGLAYDPTELSRRLAQTGKPDEKDPYTSNPFLHVGLSILANSGNQNALAGISTGVQQGLETYQGLKDTDAKRRSKELDQFLYGTQLAQGWMSQERNRRELTAYQQARLAQEALPGDLQTFMDPATGDYHTGVQVPGSTVLKTSAGDVDVSRMAPTKSPVKPEGDGGPKAAQKRLSELEGFAGTIDQLEGLAFGRTDPETGEKTPGAFDRESGLFGLVQYNDEGVIDRWMTGLANLFNSAAQPTGKTSALEYQRIIRALSPEIARLFGHTGVLSDKDLMLTLEGLPNADGYPDTQSVARKFFAEIRTKIARKRAELQGAMGGGTTPPATGDMVMPPSSSEGGGPLADLPEAELLRRYEEAKRREAEGE